MPNKMERFTQRARRVLSLAQEEAERLQHNYIGPEHFLLGLMYEDRGVAARVLKDVGLNRRRVEELFERMTRATKRGPNELLGLSPGAKKILELAVDESRRMGDHYINTEHILLGLARLNEGVAMDIFKRLNVSPEEIRRQTRRVMQENPIPPGAQSGFPMQTPSQTVQPSGGSSHQPENFVSPPLFEALMSSIVTAAQALIKPSPEDEAQLKTVVSLFVLGDWQPVLKRAIDEAKTSRHDLVRTEDLLLALISVPGEYPAYLLRALGLRWEDARKLISNRSVEKQSAIKELEREEPGKQDAPGAETGFTPYAIQALALGASQALHQVRPSLIAEYLLLGLVLQDESSAIEVLKESGIAPEEVKKAVLNVLKP